MAEKLRNPEYPASLTDGGWFIPTDYVLMKSRFRTDLERLYLDSLPPASRVLDLNAGTHGLGPQVVAAGHDYSTLEQNRLVRAAQAESGIVAEDWRPPCIPEPDSSVRLVLSLAFLEHLPTWIHAFEQLLEVKRVLAPGGRIVIVAPNGPGMGRTFWDDYKHGWLVSRKRLVDMAADAGLEVVSTRFSIGWINLMGGPVGVVARLIARSANGVLNLPGLHRLIEAVGLGPLSAKVRKTIFELVVVELRKPGDAHDES